MNEILIKRMAFSVVRHLVTLGAGYLVAQGIWTDASAPELISGITLALVGLGQSLYEKRWKPRHP